MKPQIIKPLSLLRSEILRRMQERRHIVNTFTVEDIYWLIYDSMRIAKDPRSKKAEDAATSVQNTGSFRMVADTMDEFLAYVDPGDEVDNEETAASKPTEFDGAEELQPKQEMGVGEAGLPEESRQNDFHAEELPRRGASFRRRQN